MKFKGTFVIGILAALLAMPTVYAAYFVKDVEPIVKESCVKCHIPRIYKGRKKKPGGGLRLDTPAGFTAPNEDGEKSVIAGNSAKSSFYVRTTLGEDHDDIMPSKGDILTKEQQEILKKWIDEGAKFGDWKGFDKETLKKFGYTE